MAEGGQSGELQEEHLDRLFYDIRVDHLNEDELDFELKIRDIMFDRGDSMSRKRRALREKLKQEKEEPHVDERILKGDAYEEIVICETKLQQIEIVVNNSVNDLPPRCQSTLLHLGRRVKLLRRYLGMEDQSQLDNIQERIMMYLNEFFYNKRQPIVNTGLGLARLFEESTNQNMTPVTTSESGISGIVQTSQAQVNTSTSSGCDILESLSRLGLLESENPEADDVKEGLWKLEQELYRLRRFQEVYFLRQTDAIPQPITCTSTIPKTNSISSSAGNHVRFTESISGTPSSQTCTQPQRTYVPNPYLLGRPNQSENYGVPPEGIKQYPAINTLTNPTLSYTAPRVASSISSSGNNQWAFMTTANQPQFSNPPPILTAHSENNMPWSTSTITSFNPFSAPNSATNTIPGINSLPTVNPNPAQNPITFPGINPAYFPQVPVCQGHLIPQIGPVTSGLGPNPLNFPPHFSMNSLPGIHNRKSLSVSQ